MIDVAESLLPYGLGQSDLIEVQKGYFVSRSIVPYLDSLVFEAQKNGFELRIESAYRPFEKQLSIWNRKARGELPLLDANGQPIKERPKDEEELMYTILIWSALPGASRHHLGTDIDVVDGNACPEGYEVQLTPEECNGMFRPFHEFLNGKFEADEAYGFNRVFVPGRGKIQPEKWHIAHLPTSRKLLKSFSLNTLKKIYETSDMECKNVVIARLDKLAEDFIYPYFI